MKLHAVVTGRELPGPTVVCEAGSGGFSMEWDALRDRLADRLPFVAYDRAGLGWSEPGAEQRNGAALAGDLHALLEQLAVPRPVILVAHSLGGLHALDFAGRYPDDLAGLVLVDSSMPDLLERVSVNAAQRRLMMVGALRRIGVLRLLRRFVFPQAKRFPPDQHDAYLAASLRSMPGIVAEVRGALAPGGLTLPASLGDVPLAVVTRSVVEEAPQSRRWLERQQTLCELSTHSTHVVAERAGSYVHLEEPERVAEAVLHVAAVAAGDA
jgi:pimeloyl-ACP methyl ester carboxylesterase